MANEGIVQKSYNTIDLTKFIAAIGVIYGHVEPLKTIAPETNFIIMNVLLRFIIPFFFMTSGYLYYSKYLSIQSRSKFFSDYGIKYLYRIINLYFIWSLVYFPYMLFEFFSIHTSCGELILYSLRNIFYSGTCYHMWYFTALIFSIIIIDVWSRRYKLKSLLIISFVLYIIGLLGESYYGLIPPGSFLYNAYELYFSIFLTTKNGMFFGLFYVVLGAYFFEKPPKLSVNTSVLLFVVSFCLLFSEVMLIHRFSLPRDYNYMILSIPLSIFMFQTLFNTNLSWKLNYKMLRKLSTLIYCAHVVFLIFIAKAFEYLAIRTSFGNELIIFPLVVISTILFSIWVTKLESHRYIGYMAKKMA